MTGISINHYLTPPGYPLATFLDEAVAAGATGVGLTERALGEASLPEIKRMLRERDLAVTSVNSAGFFVWSDPERAKQQRSINAFLIVSAAELAANTLVLIGGGLHDMGSTMGPASLARARQTFDAELPGIIEAAEGHGVRLGVEPMHPLRIFAKGTLNTLVQTAALCARHPKLGVVLDLFHTWWDPDLDAVLPSLVPRLTLVQICGVAQSAEDSLPKRSLPSEGVVDLDHILRLLARSGYRGKFEFELFAQDLDGREPRDIMKRAVADFAAASHQSSSR